MLNIPHHAQINLLDLPLRHAQINLHHAPIYLAMPQSVFAMPQFF